MRKSKTFGAELTSLIGESVKQEKATHHRHAANSSFPCSSLLLISNPMLLRHWAYLRSFRKHSHRTPLLLHSAFKLIVTLKIYFRPFIPSMRPLPSTHIYYQLKAVIGLSQVGTALPDGGMPINRAAVRS
ncbi:hypothetical protein, unlikely [Trypanosoma congolense IL3000]|uniref:Uncharacterized protein n=1 Tax=Trypanosoma congolense (strain IL3000) TaxID=1068625 RepID=F9WIB2_TRYCI|nr:hypothetical protein, unlikely [Trypanosoma congolense IL3000]